MSWKGFIDSRWIYLFQSFAVFLERYFMHHEDSIYLDLPLPLSLSFYYVHYILYMYRHIYIHTFLLKNPFIPSWEGFIHNIDVCTKYPHLLDLEFFQKRLRRRSHGSYNAKRHVVTSNTAFWWRTIRSGVLKGLGTNPKESYMM